jgi:hypothetical protein
MTYAEAVEAVLREINRTARVPAEECVILEEYTIVKPYGWIFFYNSRQFVETKNWLYALGGNGPAVVERDSGRVTLLGSAHPPEDEIGRFERERGLPPA